MNILPRCPTRSCLRFGSWEEKRPADSASSSSYVYNSRAQPHSPSRSLPVVKLLSPRCVLLPGGGTREPSLRSKIGHRIARRALVTLFSARFGLAFLLSSVHVEFLPVASPFSRDSHTQTRTRIITIVSSTAVIQSSCVTPRARVCVCAPPLWNNLRSRG